MEEPDRFDIVVVGVQGGEPHEATLAADLSALVGLPPGEVALALRHGELYVHRSFEGEDASRAADSLQRLGAEVEIRACAESIEMPTIEADPNSPLQPKPPAPAPIAPPPEFGGALYGRSIAIGSSGTPPDSNVLDPSRPQGRPDALSAERPYDPVFQRSDAARRSVDRTRRPQPRAPDSTNPYGRAVKPEPKRASESTNAEHTRDAVPPASVRARRATPPPRGQAGSIAADNEAERLARTLEAAAESADAIEVVTLDGQTSDSVQVKLGMPRESGPESDESIPVRSTLPAVAKENSIPKEPALAVDFETAYSSGARPRAAISASNLEAPSDSGARPLVTLPSGGPPSGAAPSGAAPSGAAPSGAAPAGLPPPGSPPRPGASGPPRAGASGPYPPLAAPRVPTAQAIPPLPPRRIFSRDMLTNYLFAVAVGVAIGIVVAFQGARMLDRDEIMDLEDELAESYVKPIEVESGELRGPDEIERELDAKYGDTRIFFILTMLFTGVPAGLAIGRIKLG